MKTSKRHRVNPTQLWVQSETARSYQSVLCYAGPMGRYRVRVGGLAMRILCAGVVGAGHDDPETEAVRLATLTLGEHLGINEQLVILDEVVAVDWPNSSLGCPEPGRTYAPIVMSGYRVTLARSLASDTLRLRHLSGPLHPAPTTGGRGHIVEPQIDRHLPIDVHGVAQREVRHLHARDAPQVAWTGDRLHELLV